MKVIPRAGNQKAACPTKSDSFPMTGQLTSIICMEGISMSNPKLTEAVRQALLPHRNVGGIYMLNAGDIIKIVTIVIKILGTLSTQECQTCISALVSDVQSSHLTPTDR